MTRGRTITVTDRGVTFVFRGYRAAAELARGAGLRPIFSGSAGGWVADSSRLADLLAYLDSRRVAYTVADDRDDDHEADRDDEHLDRNDDEHLDLFGGEVA